MSVIVRTDGDDVPDGKLGQCGDDPYPVPGNLVGHFADTVGAGLPIGPDPQQPAADACLRRNPPPTTHWHPTG